MLGNFIKKLICNKNRTVALYKIQQSIYNKNEVNVFEESVMNLKLKKVLYMNINYFIQYSQNLYKILLNSLLNILLTNKNIFFNLDFEIR